MRQGVSHRRQVELVSHLYHGSRRLNVLNPLNRSESNLPIQFKKLNRSPEFRFMDSLQHCPSICIQGYPRQGRCASSRATNSLLAAHGVLVSRQGHIRSGRWYQGSSIDTPISGLSSVTVGKAYPSLLLTSIIVCNIFSHIILGVS